MCPSGQVNLLHHKAISNNDVSAKTYPLRNTQNVEINIEKSIFSNERRGKVTNDYNILETVGKGGYGEVKKVIHKITGETRAMKIIKKESCDDTYLKALTNEVSILRMIDHPHIIKLYEIY